MLPVLFLAAGLVLRPVPSYVIDTLAGSDLAGDYGPAVFAQLSSANGIAVDQRGNVYIADTDNHRVRRLWPSGMITTVAGNGHPGFRGDGAPAEQAQLDSPYGLAADSAGNLFIADLNNHRVRRVGADGIITTVAGTGRKGSGGDGGEATRAELMSPRNLLMDANGDLWISEFEGHRVRKVGRDGIIRTVTGTGVAGLNLQTRAAQAQLCYPAGLAADRYGFVYLADSGNNLIRRIAGDSIITLLDGRRGPIAMYAPVGLAVDRSGLLHVADSLSSVRVLLNGDLKPVAGTGIAGYGGDGGPAIAARLNAPRDMAFDDAGNLFIADGQRVRRVTGGIIATVAGDAYQRAIGDGLAATFAQLRGPKGLALDNDGNLYVADSGTHRIRKVSPEGVITTVAGNGRSGFESDAAPPLNSSLYGPEGVAVDGYGGLLLADTLNQRVRRILPPGYLVTIAGTGDSGLAAEYAIAARAALRAPRSLAVDSGGTVYFADTGNHRVLRIRRDGTLETVAGNGSAGFAGDGGSARTAQLSAPASIALDAAGNLYIADTYNHRVRKVAGGVITTIAGTGAAGFSGDGGPATAARLHYPGGVALDREGCVYVSDTWNHRIRRIGGGIIQTIAGVDIAGFSGDGGPALAAQLGFPSGLAVDGWGNVFFSDSLNHRVRKLIPRWEPAPAPPLLDAAVVNAASLVSGPIAPGELIVILAAGVSPENAVQVLVDGAAAPVLRVQPGQIHAQAPYGVSGLSSAVIEVHLDGALRVQLSTRVTDTAPGLFPTILNQDGSENSEANPAARESVVTLLATGEGQTNPPGVTGKPAQPPYAQPALPVRLTIAGYPAEILSAASAPSMIGVLQIKARVPGGFAPTGMLPVVLQVGVGVSAEVRVFVK